MNQSFEMDFQAAYLCRPSVMKCLTRQAESEEEFKKRRYEHDQEMRRIHREQAVRWREKREQSMRTGLNYMKELEQKRAEEVEKARELAGERERRRAKRASEAVWQRVLERQAAKDADTSSMDKHNQRDQRIQALRDARKRTETLKKLHKQYEGCRSSYHYSMTDAERLALDDTVRRCVRTKERRPSLDSAAVNFSRQAQDDQEAGDEKLVEEEPELAQVEKKTMDKGLAEGFRAAFFGIKKEMVSLADAKEEEAPAEAPPLQPNLKKKEGGEDHGATGPRKTAFGFAKPEGGPSFVKIPTQVFNVLKDQHQGDGDGAGRPAKRGTVMISGSRQAIDGSLSEEGRSRTKSIVARKSFARRKTVGRKTLNFAATSMGTEPSLGIDRMDVRALVAAVAELGMLAWRAEDKAAVAKICQMQIDRRRAWEGDDFSGCDAAELHFEVLPSVRKRLLKLHMSEMTFRLREVDRDAQGREEFFSHIQEAVESIWPVDSVVEQDGIIMQSSGMTTYMRSLALEYTAMECSLAYLVQQIEQSVQELSKNQRSKERELQRKYCLPEDVFREFRYDLVYLDAIWFRFKPEKVTGRLPPASFLEQLHQAGMNIADEHIEDYIDASKISGPADLDKGDQETETWKTVPANFPAFLEAIRMRRAYEEVLDANLALEKAIKEKYKELQKEGLGNGVGGTVPASDLHWFLEQAGIDDSASEDRKVVEMALRAADIDPLGSGELTIEDIRKACSRAQEGLRRSAFKKEAEMARSCELTSPEISALRSAFKAYLERKPRDTLLIGAALSAHAMKRDLETMHLSQVARALLESGLKLSLVPVQDAIDGELEYEIHVAMENIGAGGQELVGFSTFLRLAQHLRDVDRKGTKDYEAQERLSSLRNLRRSELLLLLACLEFPPKTIEQFDQSALARKAAQLLGVRSDERLWRMGVSSFRDLCDLVRRQRAALANPGVQTEE